MPRRFLHAAAQDELVAAVAAIEQRTAAEIVIAVRPRAGSYLHADLLAGLIAASACLLLQLLVPWPVPAPWLLIDPLLAGLLTGLLSSVSPALRRLLTPAHARRRRVLAAARQTFVEKQVHRTQSRAGVLVHVSLTERAAELVADLAVIDAVPPETWASAAADLDRAVRAAREGRELVPALLRLGELLAAALPRQDDDVNELPDEPCAG